MELLTQYYEMKIPNIDEKPSEAASTEISRVEDKSIDLLEETIGNLSRP